MFNIYLEFFIEISLIFRLRFNTLTCVVLSNFKSIFRLKIGGAVQLLF